VPKDFVEYFKVAKRASVCVCVHDVPSAQNKSTAFHNDVMLVWHSVVMSSYAVVIV